MGCVAGDHAEVHADRSLTDLLDASVSPPALGQRPLGLRPRKGEQGVGRHRDFPSSLIHSDSLVPGGGSQARAEERRGTAESRVWVRSGARGEGERGGHRGAGPGARAGGGRPGGACAAACAGSEWLAAGGGSERSGASRSARPPPGPRLRLLRLGRTRPQSDRPRLGVAAAPPAARSRPTSAAAAAAARSVGQSVSQSRCARRGSCGRSRRVRGRSAAPEEAAAGAAGATAARPRAAGGSSSCRGECSASPSSRAERPAGRGL